jgi:hypothetical protein
MKGCNRSSKGGESPPFFFPHRPELSPILEHNPTACVCTMCMHYLDHRGHVINNMFMNKISLYLDILICSCRYFSSLEGNCASCAITFPSNRNGYNISNRGKCCWVETMARKNKQKNIYTDRVYDPLAPSMARDINYMKYLLYIS